MGEAETSTLREDIKVLRMIVEESVDARADDPCSTRRRRSSRNSRSASRRRSSPSAALSTPGSLGRGFDVARLQRT